LKHGFRLARRCGAFLSRLRPAVARDVFLENGELTVEWPLIVAAVLAGLLGLYLLVALLKPEWFS